MHPLTFRTLQLSGVVVCIIAVVIAATVYPTLAPPTFFAACVVMLFISFWVHRAEFGVDQYERNTLKYSLRRAASLIAILLVIFGLIGFWYFSKNNQNTGVLGPAPSPLALPKIGGGLTSVAQTAVSRIKEMMRTGTVDM